MAHPLLWLSALVWTPSAGAAVTLLAAGRTLLGFAVGTLVLLLTITVTALLLARRYAEPRASSQLEPEASAVRRRMGVASA